MRMIEEIDRSANPEVLLADAMLDILERGTTSTTAHLELSYKVPWTLKGSQNHPMQWLAVRSYMLKGKQLEKCVEAIRRAIAMNRNPQYGWCGSESGSTKYLGIIGSSWQMIYFNPRMPEDVKAGAFEWLAFTAWFLEMGQAPNDRVLPAGQRSAGTTQPTWADGFLARVQGCHDSAERWRKIGEWGKPDRKSADAQERTQAFDWVILAEPSNDFFVDLRVASRQSDMRRLPVQPRYWWVHDQIEDCLAVVCEKSINGNTAAILASIYDPATGKISHFPKGGGHRHRTGEKSSCKINKLEDGVYEIVYTSNVFEPGTAIVRGHLEEYRTK